MIGIVDIERRFIRACKTVRVLPDPDARFGSSGCWPEYVADASEAYGYTEAAMPRFRPTPFDVSDMLGALAWARGIDKPEHRLLWWRSFDLSFGQIARRIGRSDETARRRYKDAVLFLWGTANYGNRALKSVTRNCVANLPFLAPETDTMMKFRAVQQSR